MDTRRRWFLAALGLFVAWVATLATLAVLSARTPPRSSPEASRAG